MPNPKISIIIPTCNGAKTLAELLAVIDRQTLAPEEILVVDSSSEDDTVEIARKFGADVTVIDRREFDHGGTRSIMAGKAKSDLLVFFTQDAVPATRDALARLIEPFSASSDIAVTYGRQLPSPDATWAAASLRRFNYPETSSVRSLEDRTTLGLKTIFVSNSFAAYRKGALADVGYFKNGLIFGEDTCTVGRLLERGHRIAYVSEAKVYHSHNYSFSEEFRRSFDTGVLHAMESWLIEKFGQAEGIGVRYAARQLIELGRQGRAMLMAEMVGRNVLKYCGYRLGRSYRRIPSRLVPQLSMHRSWWDGRHREFSASGR
jgi:rhamnosyltransferase